MATTKITAESTPVFSGNLEWGLAEWVEFHRALANKYYTNTVLVTVKDKTVAKNMSADQIWIKWYAQTSPLSKVRFEIVSPISKYDDLRKYLGMWQSLGLVTGQSMLDFNPAWALVKASNDVTEQVTKGFLKFAKISAYALPIVGGVLLLGIIGYAVRSFRFNAK